MEGKGRSFGSMLRYAGWTILIWGVRTMPLILLAALYGTIRLTGWKFVVAWNVCIFAALEFCLKQQSAKTKKAITRSQHAEAAVSSALSSLAVAAFYGVFQLFGWKIFIGCVALVVIPIAIAAQIRLRKANSLAQKYVRHGSPKGATNVTVYFRAKFFKMAVLGWLMGGKANFRPMFNAEVVRGILKSRIDRYVYLNPGKIGGPAWGKLLHVGDGDNDKLGDALMLESYLGDDFGLTPTTTFSNPVAVVVTFDSDLPQKEWAPAN